MKLKSPSRILVPISNWAAFGGSKEIIVWLPIEEIANTVLSLVGIRKQVIDDIYQIVGLSDIMRGSTDPDETLGAQKMKMQSGAVRIRDKQGEMARIARDCVQITIEIITEKFEDETIIAMSQQQLPRKADIMMQVQQITQAVQQQLMQMSMQQPPMQPPMQLPMQPPMQQQPRQPQQPPMQPPPNPQTQQQQVIQQAQAEIKKLTDQATVEDVLAFLRDNRARSFTLDIETDSTIMIDEQQEKEQRGEFVAVLAGLIQQVGGMIMQMPLTAKFGGDILKFAIAPYRAGRALDSSIDEMVDQLNQMAASGQMPQGAQQQTGEDPQIKMQIEQMKLQHAAQENDKDRQLQIAEITAKMRTEQEKNRNERDAAMIEFQGAEKERQAKIIQIQAQMERDRQKHAADLQKMQGDFVLNTQKQQIAQRGQAEKNAAVRQGMAMKAQDNAVARQQKAQQFNQAARQKDQQFNQATQLKERQMLMPKPGGP
jgi:hypothetical protein